MSGTWSWTNEEGVSHREAFGKYLKQIRKGFYKESLREFAARIDLSPGYIGKLEQGVVGVPKRQTVLTMAEQLHIDPDVLLVKAGYAATKPPAEEEHEFILLKLRSIDPDLMPVVAEFLDVLAKKFPAPQG